MGNPIPPHEAALADSPIYLTAGSPEPIVQSLGQ
jgi:hypothetical protein